MRGRLSYVWFLISLIVGSLAVVTIRRFWIGIMVFIGLLFVAKNCMSDFRIAKTRRRFLTSGITGLVLLGVATWLSGFAGRWFWAATWMLAALPLLFAGVYIRVKSSRRIGVGTITASAACVFIAIVSPYARNAGLISQAFAIWFLVWVSIFCVMCISIVIWGQRTIDDKRIRIGGVLLFFTLAVIFGLLIRNILIPAMTLVGILLLYKDLHRVVAHVTYRYHPILACSLMGLALLVTATLLDGFSAGAIWTPIWMLASIPLLFEAEYMYHLEENLDSYFLFWIAAILICLGLACMLVAIVGPSLLISLSGHSAVIVCLLLISWLCLSTFAALMGKDGGFAAYLGCAIAAVVCLAAAAIISQYKSPWTLSFLWLTSAILIGTGAWSSLDKRRIIGRCGLALSICCGLLVVIGPVYGAAWCSVLAPLSAAIWGRAIVRVAAIILLAVVALFLIIKATKSFAVSRKMRETGKQHSVFGDDFFEAMRPFLEDKSKRNNEKNSH